MRRLKRTRGVILITVMWIIFLLSLLVWSMSRRSAVEVTSVRYYEGKLRSYAAARAGVNHVLNLLSSSPSGVDSLFATGITLKQDQTPENIFSHIDVGKNAFAIVEWKMDGFASPDKKSIFGLEDEGGKINVNAINLSNYRILAILLELNGLARNEANDMAMRIAAYNTSGEGMQANFSLKEDTAEGMKPKHKPVEYLEELRNIHGVSPELYKKIKSDLTVYGEAANGLAVNINTANNDVITALVKAAAELDSSVQVQDMINQAYALRDGLDGKSFTVDDGKGTMNSVLTGWPPALRQGKASFVHAHVIGVDRVSRARTEIDAVIHVTGSIMENAIVGWQRD